MSRRHLNAPPRQIVPIGADPCDTRICITCNRLYISAVGFKESSYRRRRINGVEERGYVCYDCCNPSSAPPPPPAPKPTLPDMTDLLDLLGR